MRPSLMYHKDFGSAPTSSSGAGQKLRYPPQSRRPGPPKLQMDGQAASWPPAGLGQRPISLYLQIDNPKIMSWMKDKKYRDEDRKKLEKGSGFEKFITIISHWFYRVMSW